MRVAISFTGGKDSVLATHLVLSARLREIAGWTGRQGDVIVHRSSNDDACATIEQTPIALPPSVQVACLVTFGPPASSSADDRGFKAHPLKLIRQQAAALAAGIARFTGDPPPPLIVLDVVAPHADSYARQLKRLRQDYRIDALVTGDVLDVCSGFMGRACARAGLALVTPLWAQERRRILTALDALGIRAFVTCVDVRKFEAAVSAGVDPLTMILGRELTRDVWEGPGAPLQRSPGVDLCGEGGEYHSAVFEAPHLFWPRGLSVQLMHGHKLKGDAHAHVVVETVSGGDDSGRLSVV